MRFELLNEICLVPCGDGRFKVSKELLVQINDYKFTIPKGFVTDFASIPRVFQSFFGKLGKHNIASLIHDYLYSYYNTTNINKTLADKIFLKIMEIYGVGYIKRNLMYKAVSMFGEVAWVKEKINGDIPYNDVALVDKTIEAQNYYNSMIQKIGDV